MLVFLGWPRARKTCRCGVACQGVLEKTKKSIPDQRRK